LTGFSVKLLMKEAQALKEQDNDEDEEIILLAEKGAKDGTLTSSESDMVTNALKLDDVLVTEIMTPRTVVYALEKNLSIGQLFSQQSNIEFARIPVYEDDIDNIVGVVRRRDILRHKADDQDHIALTEIMSEARFVPETITVANALQTALKTHQQILIVVDEFGSMAGVISMEDIMECILGREIFETDDKAIDMRELARHEGKKTADALAKEEKSAS
ncbi:MAG: CBS domain-containing protein, partial [Verrucomicrobiota bacterium]